MIHQHRGEILKAILQKSGYSLKALAEKLGISRNTIYNRFREHNLSYDFIVRVGELIHYDFTYAYPEIKTTIQREDKDQHAAELWWLERRYTQSLQQYNNLCDFLIKMRNDYHQEGLGEVGEKLRTPVS